MRSPIRWFGGKGNFTQHLLPLIPEHKCYVEVFGGGASLLFAKSPSKVEVYNDIDGDVVAFFRIFHDPVAFKEFEYKCQHTPYSRQWYNECFDTWKEQADSIERIYRWFVCQSLGMNGKGAKDKGWQCHGFRNKGNGFVNLVDSLRYYLRRLRPVMIDNRSWESVLNAYDDKKTFFYLDPPYIHDTRISTKAYNHEMTNFEHEALVETLLDIKGKVLLSGYPNNIYKRLERQEWHRDDIDVSCISATTAGAKQIRTECLWHNYEIQPTLF